MVSSPVAASPCEAFVVHRATATTSRARFLFHESGPVPFCQNRGSVVGALRKLQQGIVGRGCTAHGVVRQRPFVQLLMVRCRGRINFRVGKSCRFRIGVGIKKRRGYGGVAGPKAEAAHFLRICFTRDRIRQMRNSAGMRWRRASGKSRHGQIETTPEKMDRAAFAAEAGAKFLEDAIGLQEHAPEAVGIFRDRMRDVVHRDRTGSGLQSR